MFEWPDRAATPLISAPTRNCLTWGDRPVHLPRVFGEEKASSHSAPELGLTSDKFIVASPKKSSLPRDVNWRKFAKTVATEAAVYAVLMTAYFFMILHFMGSWLVDLFRQHRGWYATAAVLVMFAQGVALEILTTRLLKLVRRTEE